MADLGSGRRFYDGKLRMTEEHWLVPGMDVDVTRDPNHPDDLLEPLWMPLPALVSAVDPTDVEILWDDVPGHEAQLSDRIAGSRAAQQAPGCASRRVCRTGAPGSVADATARRRQREAQS